MQNAAPSEVVVDFSSPDELARWTAADDVLMGGISSSRLQASPEGTALFTGFVSLEQGGGFASVRSADASFDLDGARALVVRVRGDGKSYKLRVRNPGLHREISYLAPFETVPGEWRELTFRAADFVPKRRGKIIPDAPALDFEKAQGFGLLISDRQAGPFALEIAWIARR